MQRCAGCGQVAGEFARRRARRRPTHSTCRRTLPLLLLQEPANEMDVLKAVLARAKAAQAKYAHFTQEQVRGSSSGRAAPHAASLPAPLARVREASRQPLPGPELVRAVPS